ncbi:MAG: geranylgeranylglyceryl/heptaprenylglyceryl phosphate synthase [Candidatus Bathyarchaeia archaeon]
MNNKVEKYILKKIEEDGSIHMTLIDPEKTDIKSCAEIAYSAEVAGSSAIMVGGSTLASQNLLDEAINSIKSRVSIPVILFPNNLSGVSRYADAIWFMSLLNSSNTYYIIDAQALAAPLIKQYKIEALPMGYIIVGDGGAAGYIGHARPIPYNHPEIALCYALAAETLGMRFVYLEGGSGASKPIPPEMIRVVKSHLQIPLIVGGGIKDGISAGRAAEAGADIIVTGTMIEMEKDEVVEKIREIIKNIKREVKKRDDKL